ncbi:uncharacterized protein LOC111272445 isoform X2 [Varroa jacobsoni]|uniref:uncharacterized protein LOC111272445 isoform X2 n=1 Tax=Varroa jacobsoni TaxID=62625 RepID=UPI000BF46845|nr:uncharacterized protein LOC111272445 isoform X2 [Varroa jacobsoni]
MYSSKVFSEPLPLWRALRDRQLSGIQQKTSSFDRTEDSWAPWTFPTVPSKRVTQAPLDKKKNRHLKTSNTALQGFQGNSMMYAGGVINTKASSQCPYCSREVLDEQESTVVTIFGFRWHNICFRCDRCSRPLKTLGGFICILNSPNCLECYFAITPINAVSKYRKDVQETSLHDCSSPTLDTTYGSDLSTSFPGELFSVLYLNESTNEHLFMDSFRAFKQEEISYEAYRRSSTPLFVNSQLQTSLDVSFESFSQLFTTGDDVNSETNRLVSEEKTLCLLAASHQLRTGVSNENDGCMLAVSTSPRICEEQLQPSRSNSLLNCTSSYNKAIVDRVRSSEMVVVSRNDILILLGLTVEKKQNVTPNPEWTILNESRSPDKAFIVQNHLKACKVSQYLNVTHCIREQIALKARKPLQVISRSHGKPFICVKTCQKPVLNEARQRHEKVIENVFKGTLGCFWSVVISLAAIAIICTYGLSSFC